MSFAAPPSPRKVFPKSRQAIEDFFPVGPTSRIAEQESWRKEVHRPLSYLHKWWARRLGSVFREILISTGTDSVVGDEKDARPFSDQVIFDPFMGSGTTIYEAAQLGFRVIGRDINPIAFSLVKTALQPYDEEEVRATFQAIERKVGQRLRELYQCSGAGGIALDVLYFFWVKIVVCPGCQSHVELFKSRIFAKHAYPQKHPQAFSCCPGCGEVHAVLHDDTDVVCPRCAHGYNPQEGAAAGARACCGECKRSFSILEAVRQTSLPPSHRMYAKMVLHPSGRKEFLATTLDDQTRFQTACTQSCEVEEFVPSEAIENGHNTKQILNYNYRFWHQMFNPRQKLALGLLAREIAAIPDPKVRELFASLFLGTLEFNNLFASFKGLGTGAVRHLFSHHVLKTEMMPIEANVWGTDKSSGAFSTLFSIRILRALAFKAKAQNASECLPDIGSLNRMIVDEFEKFEAGEKQSVYLSVGDSAQTDLPDGCVDAVVTDPPFFDNVHYSELADFFHVWLRRVLGAQGVLETPTTRSAGEVQSASAVDFSTRLTGVWRECHRVLREEGLLVFTYHHSKDVGWTSLLQSLAESGFTLIRTYPVKAEMAGAVPLGQTKEPISFDLIFVCRKTSDLAGVNGSSLISDTKLLDHCVEDAAVFAAQLEEEGLRLMKGDTKLILTGCLLSRVSNGACEQAIARFLRLRESLLERAGEVSRDSKLDTPISTRFVQPELPFSLFSEI